MENTKTGNTRLHTLDLLRGATLVSMILYHGMWDFLYLSGAGASMSGLRAWYEGAGGHLWQQSICRTFIFLSGFCIPLSGHLIRRGLEITAGGIAVSAVTLLAMYEERVLFGVLTFLGAAMLLTGGLRRLAASRKADETTDNGRTESGDGAWIRWLAGTLACLLLFHLTRWINLGYLRLGNHLRIPLPAVLYGGGIPGWILTGLGFTMKGFYSTDYFSLLPWIFLFWSGTCLHHVLAGTGRVSGERTSWLQHPAFYLQLPVLNRMGQHSLLLYLLHQPVLYLLVSLLCGH